MQYQVILIKKERPQDGRKKFYNHRMYDKDAYLDYFDARDYDPTVGRWISKDPIGFNGGDTNLYAYVGGNSMSYVDPTGLAGDDLNTAQCAKLLKKIENLQRDIAKRSCDIKDNPLKLPYNPPYEGAPPRMSVKGHEELLQDRKDNLKRSQDLYNSSCGGKGGGGSLLFDPSNVPILIPIRIPLPPIFDFALI